MKKIFAIILIISILFSFEANFANSMNLVVDSKTALPGDKVSINISLNDNTGIIAALLKVEYDSSRLKLTGVKDGGLLSGATFNPDYNKIPYTLLWNSATATNFTGNGVLATLTFNVLETAQNGEAAIKLSFNENDVFDVDLNNVALNIVNGKITVVGGIADNTTQNKPTNEPSNEPANESTNEQTNKPTNEPANKETNKPTNDITIHHSSAATSHKKPSANQNFSENTQTEAPAFSDTDVKDWYYDAVNYVVKNKLMNGISKTTFAPNINLTRAMLVTILYRIENEPDTKKSTPFTDVDANSYYANAVNWAKTNGIVSGISETTFAPYNNITREQFATIIYRYAKYKNYDVSNSKNANILSYDDSSIISKYAKESMQYAVGSGIITGKSATTLNPTDNTTRAETAAILMRFLETNK